MFKIDVNVGAVYTHTQLISNKNIETNIIFVSNYNTCKKDR